MAKTRGFYPAPLRALATTVREYGRSAAWALRAEREAFAKLAGSDTSKKLVGLFFLSEELKKAYQAPVPIRKAVEDAPVRSAAVLGAGKMGGGIGLSLYQYLALVKEIVKIDMAVGILALLAAAAEPRLKAAAPFLGIIDLVGCAGRGALTLSEFETAQVRKLDSLYAIQERPAAALLAQYGADGLVTAEGLVSRFEGRLKLLYAEAPERFRLIRHRGVAHEVNLPMIRNAVEWLDVFLKKG